jgi:hypothetical protein
MALLPGLIIAIIFWPAKNKGGKKIFAVRREIER